MLESAALDRGYDADRSRERLASDGIEAVIPPLPTRCGKLPLDQERYRERNRIERFFNKLKQFCRLATRYDKLAKTFRAPLHLVAAFLLPELKFVVQQGLVSLEAVVGCFVGMSFSWSSV